MARGAGVRAALGAALRSPADGDVHERSTLGGGPRARTAAACAADGARAAAIDRGPDGADQPRRTVVPSSGVSRLSRSSRAPAPARLAASPARVRTRSRPVGRERCARGRVRGRHRRPGRGPRSRSENSDGEHGGSRVAGAVSDRNDARARSRCGTGPRLQAITTVRSVGRAPVTEPETSRPPAARAYVERGWTAPTTAGATSSLRRLPRKWRSAGARHGGANRPRPCRSSRAPDWDEQQRLDRAAPPRLAVPSGRSHPLEYHADGTVSASVKLQELFGLAETPRVGPRQEPVLFLLLAPNARPVQTTRDLRSFWERTYPEVRKELRGRYPKHPWPEDPWTATATARTQKRR